VVGVVGDGDVDGADVVLVALLEDGREGGREGGVEQREERVSNMKTQ
jgi:hypothetical protein